MVVSEGGGVISAMKSAQPTERRRHQRYDAKEIGCRLEWFGKEVQGALKPYNLSARGVCLRLNRRVAVQEQVWLRVILPEPMGEAAVRCVVRWIREIPGGEGWLAGVEILESTKAWIGPEEDCWGGLVR